MSYAQENGYTPVTFDELMNLIMIGINTQFRMSFTTETFVGTHWYNYFYTLVQRVLENQIKASEIFAKLQQYISLTNQKIQRPSVSLPGLIDSFESKGYIIAVQKTEIMDAGEMEIAVDLTGLEPDYAAKKAEIGMLLSQYIVAGMQTNGTEVVNVVLSNGQNFPFKFRLAYRQETLLRLTIQPSENQVVTIPDDETIRLQLFNNIKARYRLGWDFEPQRYYTQADAPWAGSILLEYSTDDGSTWTSEVSDKFYDYLFEISVENIEVIIE